MPGPTASAPGTRSLGLVTATALVVANMIGTGVFTTSGFLLADLKSPWPVLGVWFGGRRYRCSGCAQLWCLGETLARIRRRIPVPLPHLASFLGIRGGL